uniref:Putative secreted protein 94 n=1 Tax=Amblyomma parvum TaxID=251391 RepID=A0A023FYX0_AMBPA
MLLVAFLIAGSGLFATVGASTIAKQELNGTQIYKRSLKLLRSKATLKLILYSPGIEERLQKCMFSNFLNKIDHGAQRTFITAYMNTSISIVLRNGSKPALEIKSHGDALPYLWREIRYIKHIAPKDCIILQASSYYDYGYGPLCMLLGFRQNYKCEDEFLDLCDRGDFADPTACNPIKSKAKQDVK